MCDSKQVPRVAQRNRSCGGALQFPRRNLQTLAIVSVGLHLAEQRIVQQSRKNLHGGEVRRLGAGQREDPAIVDEKQVILPDIETEVFNRQSAIAKSAHEGMLELAPPDNFRFGAELGRERRRAHRCLPSSSTGTKWFTGP